LTLTQQKMYAIGCRHGPGELFEKGKDYTITNAKTKEKVNVELIQWSDPSENDFTLFRAKEDVTFPSFENELIIKDDILLNTEYLTVGYSLVCDDDTTSKELRRFLVRILLKLSEKDRKSCFKEDGSFAKRVELSNQKSPEYCQILNFFTKDEKKCFWKNWGENFTFPDRLPKWNTTSVITTRKGTIESSRILGRDGGWDESRFYTCGGGIDGYSGAGVFVISGDRVRLLGMHVSSAILLYEYFPPITNFDGSQTGFFPAKGGRGVCLKGKIIKDWIQKLESGKLRNTGEEKRGKKQAERIRNSKHGS